MLIVSAVRFTIDAEDPSKVAVKDDNVSRIRKELFSPAVGLRPMYAIIIIYDAVRKENIPLI